MIRSLYADYQAIFQRDPAAKCFFGVLEVVFTYAGFHAMISHRINHMLYQLKVPFFPRLFSQITRFFTGIEIHPGAKIGPGFFIDHGMGVVIGETTIIGKDVTIFQGVTLGGTGKQREKRHPTLGDNVVVGAGAKILGNILIGKNVKIGAGSVVVESIPSNATVVGVPGVIVKRHGKKVSEVDLNHGDIPHPVQEKIKYLQKEIDALFNTLKALKKEDTFK